MTDAPKPARWEPATVVSVRQETPRVKTIRFSLEQWPGHMAGQHADVRLTAPDGYRAERGYSIASPPEEPPLELTVDRLDDGEVSPFLTEQLQPGDRIELRGPIGRYFVWNAATASRPLLLVGGGTGIVPLMCMLRHRRLARSTIPAALIYSCRTRADIIYHDELSALATAGPAFTLRIRLTRDTTPDPPGRIGRIDAASVEELVSTLGSDADCFVCGSNRFVEAAAALLLQAGIARESIRTERFGGA